MHAPNLQALKVTLAIIPFTLSVLLLLLGATVHKVDLFHISVLNKDAATHILNVIFFTALLVNRFTWCLHCPSLGPIKRNSSS